MITSANGKPIFIVTPDDENAPVVVQFWAETGAAIGVSKKRRDEALATAARMIEWQLEHGVRAPE